MAHRKLMYCTEVTATRKRAVAEEKFNKYISSVWLGFPSSYSFSKKMRKWVSRMPDYSKLPNELLHMIATHTACPQAHEDGNQLISKDLLKMRLVCKTFSVIATEVFLSLVQQEKYSDYTILNLPPKSGSLNRLADIFCDEGIMAKIVTSLKYHVVKTARHDVPDTDFLHEAICGRHGNGCECDHDENDGYLADCIAEDITEQNMSRFKKLCQAQDTFADQLGKPDALKKLRSIFYQLPNLSLVHIDMPDFYDGLCYWAPDGESEAVPAMFYKKALPVLLEAISAAKATELEFTGFGSYTLGSLHPLLINKLGRKKDFLKNIVSLEIIATHSDDVDNPEWGEPYLDRLTRGDRLGLFLSCFKNLEYLSLSYEDENEYNGAEIDADDVWLEEVLQGQTLNHLNRINLEDFHAKGATLKDFFRQHKRTLENVALADLHISDIDWLMLLNFMRDELSLTEASIKLSKSQHSDLPALKQILDDCVDLGAPAGDEVDVGSFVLRPANWVDAMYDGRKKPENSA